MLLKMTYLLNSGQYIPNNKLYDVYCVTCVCPHKTESHTGHPKTITLMPNIGTIPLPFVQLIFAKLKGCEVAVALKQKVTATFKKH